VPAASTPLLDGLVADHGDELIGLSEFAELLGLTESRTAQLRAERNRDPEFPPAIQSSGRSIVHALGSLLAWMRRSRFADEVAVAPEQIWRWRLERSAQDLATAGSGLTARQVIAGVALARASEPFAGQFATGEPTVVDLVQRARKLRRPRPATAKGLVIDPPAGADGSFMADLLGAQRVTKQLGAALVHDLDGLWTACLTSAGAGHYADHVERTIRAIADSSRQTHRATSSLAHLVALLVDAAPGDVVFEPTCGECDTLVRVALMTRRTRGGTDVVAVGSDRDADALRIGRARLALHGVPGRLSQSDAFEAALDRPAERMIVDPGPVHPVQLAQWTRLVAQNLTSEGRAVLVLGLARLDRRLAEDLPPARIVVLPRGVTAPGVDAALWVHDRAVGRGTACDVIDLRQPARLTSPDERLGRFLDAIGHSAGEPSRAAVDLAPTLGHLLPHTPHVTSLPLDDLHRRFRALAEGPLRSADERDVVEDNQRWALQLTRELERLVAVDAGAQAPHLPGAPERSPSGVLAASTSDEARRIIRRLRTNLDPDATTRRGRPRRTAVS
jgi:hypothetical protein